MNETIELHYDGWVLTVSSIDKDGMPKSTQHLAAVCRPYRFGGVSFCVTLRATGRLLSVVDVPDDPGDDTMIEAYVPTIWLINRQRRTAALTFIEDPGDILPSAGRLAKTA